MTPEPASLLARLRRLDAEAYRAPWDIDWTRDRLIDPEDGELIVTLRNALPEIIEAFELLREFQQVAVTEDYYWSYLGLPDPKRLAALFSKVSEK